MTISIPRLVFLLGISTVLTPLVGCLNAGPVPTDRSLATLTLSGESGDLVLEMSPFDPAYVGRYENPTLIDAMTVRVAATGKLASECAAAGFFVACSGVPFFSEVTPDGTGQYMLRVWDVHGRTVFRTITTETEILSRRAPEASVLDETAQPSEESVDAGVETPPPAPDRLTEPTAEIEDICDVDVARARFCQGVNDRIREEGLAGELDCRTFEDSFRSSARLPDDDDLEVGCKDLTEPVEETLEDEMDERDGRECLQAEIALAGWDSKARWALRSQGICRSSPLILDLNGDGVHLSSVEEGVSFDLFGNNQPVQTAWPDGEDGLLVMDHNEDGRITSGTELFGNRSFGGQHDDGFAALAQLDENGDGTLSVLDSAFAELQVWVDQNRNGQSESTELSPLASYGVLSIDLAAERIDAADALDPHGNTIPLVSRFHLASGTGAVVDAFFRFRSADWMK